MSNEIDTHDTAAADAATSKIGTFSQHVEANDADVDAVITALETAGFTVEEHERVGVTAVRDDPYYLIRLPDATPTDEATRE